jgi:hypothetical protein
LKEVDKEGRRREKKKKEGEDEEEWEGIRMRKLSSERNRLIQKRELN